MSVFTGLREFLFELLLSSLWWGFAIACLNNLSCLFTKRADSQKRYKILSLNYTLFFAGLVVVVLLAGFPGLALVDPGSQLKKLSGLLVTLWSVFAFIKCFRLLFNLASLRKKRKSMTRMDEDVVRNYLLGYPHLSSIKLLPVFVSSQMDSAALLGYCKPMIILPHSLIRMMSKEELASIILHETAHYQRKDHLVNLFQAFFDCLLYFNPAYQQLSAGLRTERENCCDDWVLQKTGNPLAYIRALKTSYEFRYARLNMPALYFAKEHNPVVERIERLINRTEKKGPENLHFLAMNFFSWITCFILL